MITVLDYEATTILKAQLRSCIMFDKSRYFGLRGTSLNVAIAVLAGLDFLQVGQSFPAIDKC